MANPWERYAAPQPAQDAAPAPADATKTDGPWSKFAQTTAAPAASGQPETKAPKSSVVGGVVSAMAGPSLGFYDEMVGATGAAVEAVGNLTPFGTGRSVGEAYQHHRDAARASADAYLKENPVRGQVERAVASIPAALVAPVGQVAKAGGALTQAAKIGAGYGAVAGAGDSTATNPWELSKDIATGAAGGAALGPVVAVGANAASTAAKGLSGIVGKAVEGSRAADFVSRVGIEPAYNPATAQAAQKINQAIERDAGGYGPLTNPMDIIAARQKTLGPESTIADAGGQNVKQLLDTLSTLPGKTKDVTERLIHDRQAGRADRLIGAAESGLGTNGARLPQTLEALDAARKEAAGPLYDRVRQTTLAVDPVLESLLERSSNAFGVAKRIAEANGQKFTLMEGSPGVDALMRPQQKVAPLSQLDTLKRSLYDLEQAYINPETGRLNELGNAYKDLRRELVAKIDSMTADPKTGESFYKSARDAYAGFSELRAAANLGSQAMSKDAWRISQITDGLSPSEMEAFKIGAFESLRKKLGTEGGQTQILKMWKEPATSEKLRELFGDQKSFREFAADVAREARLKRLESVGRGSQTAARAAGLGDLDTAAITEAGNAARSAATGNVTGLVNAAAQAWNKVKTPEPVRDEMGRLLTGKGEQGAKNLNEIRGIVEQILGERARRAAQAGIIGGTLQQ